MKNIPKISEEIIQALASKRPVVALESTVISHGLPWPDNFKIALKLEEIIRDRGALPATIAILGGKIKVGLEAEEIEYLSRATDIAKVSRRDLAWVVADRQNGATTVAATMIIAAMAGIKIFATGGIGGVHRGGETSMDISADLQELAATDVAVVCAGAKSVLDIGRTLEYLETMGVPVITYKSDWFPAFFTLSSGFESPIRADTPQQIANMLRAKTELKLRGGTIIANPIPDMFEINPDMLEEAINDALAQAKVSGITGKEITPFLLSKVREATQGKTLEANCALLENNAALAADIAVAYMG